MENTPLENNTIENDIDENLIPLQMTVLDEEILEKEMIIERQKLLKEIERDTSDILSMYGDMRELVEQDQENLDIIDNKISHTVENIDNANVELKQASKFQKVGRKIIVGLGTVSVGITTVILGLKSLIISLPITALVVYKTKS